MRRLTLFLCLLMPSLASAQPSGWNDPSICFLDGATGSFISIDGDSSFILSCAHGLKGVGSVCEGRSREGKQLRCQVVAMNGPGDAAILKFNGTASQPARISATPAHNGERLWYCGFPMGKQLATKTMVARCSLGTTDPINLGDGAPIFGDSGGPVRNEKGELVGVISGTRAYGVNEQTGQVYPTGINEAFYAQHKTIVALIDEVRAKGYVKTQCGPNGCGPCFSGQCSNGWCPQPAYRIQPSAPAIQPINPPITPPKPTQPIASIPGPQGERGEKGERGEQGPPGPGSACACGPKWTSLEAELVLLRQEVAAAKAKPSTVNFVNADGKVVATTTVTPGATSSVTLPPINFRVQDQRGASFSTEYQPAQLGSYVTLPFGPAK